MGEPGKPEASLLMLTAFSHHPEALRWAAERIGELWGPLLLQSALMPFSETKYYGPAMGEDLKVQITAYREIDPAELADIKLATNSLEKEFKASRDLPEERPLNLDPGYLTAGKYVLATTKDASHRIYLGRGIFAEVTLHFSNGEWRARESTYPNYRRDDYRSFLLECRKAWLKELRLRRQGTAEQR